MLNRFRSALGSVVFCLLGAGLAEVFQPSPDRRSPYVPALLDLVVSEAHAKRICDHSSCQAGVEPREPTSCLRADGITNTRCSHLSGRNCKTKPC
jgi:hypothetical protein